MNWKQREERRKEWTRLFNYYCNYYLNRVLGGMFLGISLIGLSMFLMFWFEVRSLVLLLGLGAATLIMICTLPAAGVWAIERAGQRADEETRPVEPNEGE